VSRQAGSAPQTAMKGGDKQGRGRLLALQLESSPLFRRVSVVVVCFLFVLVFLYCSGHDGAVFDIRECR
jgi:hypothetical protein